MAHYIDADKLRAEIERKITSCKTKNGFPSGIRSAIRIETLETVICFLDTLDPAGVCMPDEMGRRIMNLKPEDFRKTDNGYEITLGCEGKD